MMKLLVATHNQGKIREYAALLADLPELEGKTLFCWCKPDACHGDVLGELADTRQGGSNER